MKQPTKQQLLEKIAILNTSLGIADAQIHWLKRVVEKARGTAHFNGTIQGEIVGAVSELRKQLEHYDKLYVNGKCPARMYSNRGGFGNPTDPTVPGYVQEIVE